MASPDQYTTASGFSQPERQCARDTVLTTALAIIVAVVANETRGDASSTLKPDTVERAERSTQIVILESSWRAVGIDEVFTQTEPIYWKIVEESEDVEYRQASAMYLRVKVISRVNTSDESELYEVLLANSIQDESQLKVASIDQLFFQE